MKKVGIITICDYQNYGNRLQNYAVQEVLTNMGYEVETILNTPPKQDELYQIEDRSIVDRVKDTPISLICKKIKNKIKYRINRKKYNKCINEKRHAFKVFTQLHITETKFNLTKDNIKNEELKKFEYFFVGSDQIWNPIFRHGFEVDFLTFAPVNKRIAYAPSFGITVIPEEYKDRYTKWIKGMRHLSVREDAGKKIIKELADREAEVLVDPTLMLTKDKWLSIARTSKYRPKEEYILTYFLGDVPKEAAKKINQIKKKYKMKVVNLASIDDQLTYITGPSEFIDYINSCKIFFTDSFHGAVFSILLEKPFVILDRIGNGPTMNSRIDTLLHKFKLEERKWSNIKDKEIFCINYTHVKEILEYEREKTLTFLKKATDN